MFLSASHNDKIRSPHNNENRPFHNNNNNNICNQYNSKAPKKETEVTNFPTPTLLCIQSGNESFR